MEDNEDFLHTIKTCYTLQYISVQTVRSKKISIYRRIFKPHHTHIKISKDTPDLST